MGVRFLLLLIKLCLTSQSRRRVIARAFRGGDCPRALFLSLDGQTYMAIEETVRDRILALMAEANGLSQANQHGQVQSKEQMHKCSGWIAAALNVVQLVVSNPSSGYRLKAEEIAARPVGFIINSHVGEFRYLLENLIKDVDTGLLSSVADRARAEVFDDFLDHAKAYVKAGKKNEAGVIAGVVFEDSLRKVCRKNGIPEAGRKLDELISELSKVDLISQTKAKRARVAADVRTKATHAQWEEFDLNDVKVTIEFTEEFITAQLE